MLTKQILNYPSYTITNNGDVRNTITKYNLQSKTSRNGLAMVLLRDANGDRHWVEIQTLLEDNFTNDELIGG